MVLVCTPEPEPRIPATRRLLVEGFGAPEDPGVRGLRRRGLGKLSWVPDGERLTAPDADCSFDARPGLEGALPLVSVVTPVFDGLRHLPETLASVQGQSYPNVEHIVVDGGSRDGTVELLQAHDDRIDAWTSGPDGGMYEAVARGLASARGDILCWLNADDVLLPFALELVAEVFTSRPEVDWLTGVPAHMRADGAIVNVEHPKTYFRPLIAGGFYRSDVLGFIQQESCFFRRRLYERAPLQPGYRLAGDFHLWRGFARCAHLYTVKTMLAAFRCHEGQLSRDLDRYLQECGPRPRLGRLPGLKVLLRMAGVLSEGRVIRLDPRK